MKKNAGLGRWMVLLFAAGAMAVYLCLVFLPGQRSLAALRSQVKDAKQFIAQIEAFGPAVVATQQELEKAEQYVERWKQAAPTEDELSGVFGRINRLAKRSEVTTTRLEPQPAVAYHTIRQIPVMMACEGSFDEIGRFLQGLEGLEETVWIEGLEMQSLGEDGEDVGCELGLVVFADNSGNSDQDDRSD